MIRHIFPPEGTIPITELSIAVVSKRIGHWSWISPYSSKPRKERDDPTINALVQCEHAILEALKSKRLIAYAFRETTEGLWPVPAEYWTVDAAAVSLQGRMFDFTPGQTFAAELDDAPVVIKSADATAWLKEEGIPDTDQFFPDSLRVEFPTSIPFRKPQYERQAFIDEAVARLHHNGALLGKGSQSAFEEEMRVWYEDKFGESPAKRTIRNYVKRAEQLFNQEKVRGSAP